MFLNIFSHELFVKNSLPCKIPFKKCLFQFSGPAAYSFFQGTFLNCFYAIFGVGFCWFQNIYICPIHYTLNGYRALFRQFVLTMTNRMVKIFFIFFLFYLLVTPTTLISSNPLSTVRYLLQTHNCRTFFIVFIFLLLCFI